MAAALRGTALLEATPTGRAFDQVFSVARQHALTAYDGAHLELSLREGQSLAAIDGSSLRIVRAGLGRPHSFDDSSGLRSLPKD
jgi:hypothetical protein